MLGQQTAACASLQLDAITVHRCELQLNGQFYDLHVRISDDQIN